MQDLYGARGKPNKNHFILHVEQRKKKLKSSLMTELRVIFVRTNSDLAIGGPQENTP